MTLTEIRIATHRPYGVWVGSEALARAAGEADGRRVAVLTDSNVAPLHLSRLGPLASEPVLAIDPGERSKRFEVLEHVLEFMASAGLDRGSLLVALGGGVVGDLGGLAAALYMRGIEVVQGPTTLVAQVDAAIGGKTAVNLTAGKNLAGAFHQPRAVLADPETLTTLGEEDFQSGLGEVVKSALIGDPELLTLLERELPRVPARDGDVLGEIVARCVRVKGRIVAADERESGERKQLNLGHTFAHAIEHVAGYGRIPHGIAVGTGLGLALEASARAGLLEEPELAARTQVLLEGLGLHPTLSSLRERYGVPLEADALVAGMHHDKKGGAGRPAFVLPRRLGSVTVDVDLERQVLVDILG